MRVAIVGAGISGLGVAWQLAEHAQIDLIEAEPRIGGHVHTVDVDDPLGPLAVDTGFIVFNDSTYPGFLRLMEELGLSGRPTTMSFSVRDDAGDLEYRGVDLPGLFAQKRNLVRPKFWRLLSDFVRFKRAASRLTDEREQVSVGEFLRSERFSDVFVHSYFLPMGSAVWSCPRETFERFPIRFIIDFYRNHGMLGVQQRPQWRVVPGGSREYVRALLKRLPLQVRDDTPIERIQRHAAGVELFSRGASIGRYDHVVMACHADQSLRILGDQATSLESELLAAFPYEANRVQLHTDASVMPRRRAAWACWNYRADRAESEKASVTYWMNLLQGFKAKRDYFVTLNDHGQIDPDKVIRTMVYHHPVFSIGRAVAQQRHHELIDHHHISYCGAYWANGFHEDGLQSGLRVAERLLPRITQADHRHQEVR